MLYQLPNGRTVEMTIDQFLRLSDSDIQHLVAGRHGEERNDPFYGSALRGLSDSEIDPDLLLAGDEVSLDDLPSDDQPEMAHVAGLQAVFDDGDYFAEED